MINCIVTDSEGALSGSLRKLGCHVISCAPGGPFDLTDNLLASDRIDLVVHTGCMEGYTLDPWDFDAAQALYARVVQPPMELVRNILPRMTKSNMRRLCFFTSAKASINLCEDSGHYAFYMAHAALHMRLRILHNELPDYAIKLYDPGEKPNADAIAQMLLRPAFAETADPTRNVDNHLLLMDWLGRAHPW